MNLHVIPAGPIQTNAYLLTAADRGEAVLVDAPPGIWAEVGPLLAKQQCRLVELWLTHGHWDHTLGAAEVVRQTGAKVRGHPDDRPMFERPEMMRLFMFGENALEPVAVDHWLKQGDRIEVLGTSAEVRHVPGHCPGNVLFYFASHGFTLVGDALFSGAIGRTDLPGGSFEQLARSIRDQIYTLPDNTVVFPGHGPKTTVGEEKTGNPYVTA